MGGFPKVQHTFARVMGYVEQSDIHSPMVRLTVQRDFAHARMPSVLSICSCGLFCVDLRLCSSDLRSSSPLLACHLMFSTHKRCSRLKVLGRKNTVLYAASVPIKSECLRTALLHSHWYQTQRLYETERVAGHDTMSWPCSMLRVAMRK